jgi:branched-chain amino acid transport system ATP-binding protein
MKKYVKIIDGIGRALMLKPSLLLLDEPSLGLSPNYVEAVFEKLVEINKDGTSILLVEQNVFKALQVCHRGYLFEIGSVVLEGEKQTLLKSEKIKEVLLGG